MKNLIIALCCFATFSVVNVSAQSCCPSNTSCQTSQCCPSETAQASASIQTAECCPGFSDICKIFCGDASTSDLAEVKSKQHSLLDQAEKVIAYLRKSEESL